MGLIQFDWYPFNKNKKETWGMQAHREKAMWGQRKKATIYNPGREISGETNPADTLILGLQASRAVTQYYKNTVPY